MQPFANFLGIYSFIPLFGNFGKVPTNNFLSLNIISFNYMFFNPLTLFFLLFFLKNQVFITLYIVRQNLMVPVVMLLKFPLFHTRLKNANFFNISLSHHEQPIEIKNKSDQSFWPKLIFLGVGSYPLPFFLFPFFSFFLPSLPPPPPPPAPAPLSRARLLLLPS